MATSQSCRECSRNFGRATTRNTTAEVATRSQTIAVGGTIEKYVRMEQRVERVEVDGQPGIWVEGRHVVSGLFGEPRLAGNVLLWEQEGLTLRLEGRFTKEQALDLARSVR